jgi:hypothetical protein
MERYHFKVRRTDGTVSVVRSAMVCDLSAVWAIVAEIAQGIEQVGSRILVTNDSQQVLILVGVATGRAYPTANSKPDASPKAVSP